MKKSTKLMTLLMAMVLSTGSLAACGGDDSSSPTSAPASTDASGEQGGSSGGETQKVDLTLWVPQEDTQKFGDYGDNLAKYMCDEFNKAQSKWDLNVTIKPMAENEVADPFTKDPANAADVMMAANDHMIKLYNRELISSITVEGVEEVKQNNPELAIKDATFHNEAANADLLYGVPYSPNTWFMYYDKSKLDENDVKSLETIMSKDIKDTKYNFSMPLKNGWYNPSFFFAAGCSLFGEDGRDKTICDFNSKAGVSAAKYMLDLTKNKKFFCDENESVAINFFKDGSLAAWCGGTWNADTVKKQLGKNYAAAAMPTVKIDGKDTALKPYSGYKYLIVNKASKNVEAAQDLAVWLGGEQCQTDRLKAREVAPTWTSVAESDDAKNSPAIAACIEQGAIGYPQPGITQMDNTWNALEAFGTWITGNKASEDGIQGELDKLRDNILAEIKEEAK